MEDDSVPDFSQLAEAIKIWGKEPGFQEVRIADANTDMAQSEYGLQQWLNEGYHGEMDYMVKHAPGALGRRSSFPDAEGDFGTHELYACGEG